MAEALIASGPVGGGIRFTMSAPNAKPIDVALSRFGGQINDFTPFWRDYFAPLLFENTRRNIETRGGFVGGWAPLSPTYAAWKAMHFPGKDILRRTDRLFKSLQYANGSVGPEGIARFTPTRAELGTSVPYAVLHQTGTKHLPARRVLAVPSSETAGRTLQRFAIDTMRNAGVGTSA